MTLTAPADGVIIRRDGEIGQLMQPGNALFWMYCCDSLRVAAEIDEEDIDQDGTLNFDESQLDDERVRRFVVNLAEPSAITRTRPPPPPWRPRRTER